MKNHLSSEQISKGMLGEWTSEEQQHATECVQCRAECTQLHEVLALFRGSVRDWADWQGHPEIPTSATMMDRPRCFRGRGLRWALATGALLLVVVIPIHNNVTQRQRETAAAEDEMLLEQVDEHLARPVASSMQPFLELLNGEQQ